MEEKVERRQDQKDFMLAIKRQNEILEAQNVLLRQIVAFITPVSAFFAGLKNFVIIMAWIVGFLAAGLALWHGFIGWLIAWAKSS